MFYLGIFRPDLCQLHYQHFRKCLHESNDVTRLLHILTNLMVHQLSGHHSEGVVDRVVKYLDFWIPFGNTSKYPLFLVVIIQHHHCLYLYQTPFTVSFVSQNILAINFEDIIFNFVHLIYYSKDSKVIFLNIWNVLTRLKYFYLWSDMIPKFPWIEKFWALEFFFIFKISFSTTNMRLVQRIASSVKLNLKWSKLNSQC